MYLNLGAKIKELRLKNGRTQETLANAFGITSQVLHNTKIITLLL